MKNVRLISSSQVWMESEAVRQLEQTAQLEGVRLAVGLPDLHPGKGHPVGAAFVVEDRIYPYLIGSDIGCGMGFWQTDIPVRKVKLERWAGRLSGLESPWDGPLA
jgi:release factor H-coupled RctB family protein